ncbi:MAG TPA: hypothetical protein PLI53_00490 [Geobacteraceae bacterium]|nr:hypothetical protein [Geobacteraceae bacterium]
MLNSQCQRDPDTFPFTVRKDSAEGTLSVSDALRVFSIRTLVAAKGSDANRRIIKSIVSNRVVTVSFNRFYPVSGSRLTPRYAVELVYKTVCAIMDQ